MSEHRRKLRRFENPYHGRYLTFSCYHRLPLFGNDRIKDAFVDQLSAVKAELGFHLYAWVIMPEHVHLLLRTSSHDQTMKQILRRLKSSFAQQVIGRWRDLKAPILAKLVDASNRTRFWLPGGGYDRNIYTEHELHEKINYIHENPVRRGLVTRTTDYRWSSARWFTGVAESGPAIDLIV